MCHVESTARGLLSIQRSNANAPLAHSRARSQSSFIGLARWLLCLVPTTSNSPATMGILISRLFEGLFGSKEVRILILGLDNAGKTTILYRLQNESDEAVQTIPTIGFNVETLQYKNIKVRQRTSRAGGADGWRRRRRGRPAGGETTAGHLVIGLPPSFSTLNTSLQSSRTN